MRRIATGIVLLLTVSALAETPQEIERRLLRAEVKALRKQAETQAGIIRELRAEIARLRKLSPSTQSATTRPIKTVPPVKILQQFKEPLAVGQAAKIKIIKVIQVQDKQNLLAEITLANRGRPYSITDPITGVTVTGNHPKKTFVWIARIDTNGMVDGTTARIDKILKIAGTKRYQTARGAKTVFLLEPLAP